MRTDGAVDIFTVLPTQQTRKAFMIALSRSHLSNDDDLRAKKDATFL